MRYTVQKRDYSLKATWEEITLREAIQLAKLEINEDQFKIIVKEEDVDQLNDTQLTYMRDVVKLLTDAKPGVIDGIDSAMLLVLFTQVRYLIYGLYFMNIESYKPKGTQEITFNGKKYYTPETLTVNDENIVAYKEKSKFVTEANNIMTIIGERKKEGIELLNLLCAIYLKEDPDEDYDDEKISQRAAEFNDLPMSIVWEVFFCIFYSYINYALALKIYLEEKAKMTPLKRLSLTILGLLVLPLKVLQEGWKKLRR